MFGEGLTERRSKGRRQWHRCSGSFLGPSDRPAEIFLHYLKPCTLLKTPLTSLLNTIFLP